jgi:protocatechuate 3,4-dioxygenase beta subunit
MSSHSRRSVLRTGALGGAAVLGALSLRGFAETAVASVPTASARAALATSTGCTTLTEELTQGPFWVDEKLNRSDIRPDSGTGAVQAGVPLTLTINLQDAGAGCVPQVGAYVDIWHANAQGAYSDVSGSGNPDNVGVDWLRGYQVSDDNGSVTFTTVMPGYYVSRTIHIHFRVRLTLADDSEVNFTSQLFFDETVNAAVLATSAYQQSQARDTLNSTDQLYDAALLVPVTGSATAGYAGAFTVNLDFGDGAGTTTTTPATADDTVVDARIVRATVVRGKRHRIVRVVIRNDEKVTAKVRLVRGDRVLAKKTWGWLPRGRRVLKLRVPDSVPFGRARVMVTFADAAGNNLVSRKPVHVPPRLSA